MKINTSKNSLIIIVIVLFIIMVPMATPALSGMSISKSANTSVTVGNRLSFVTIYGEILDDQGLPPYLVGVAAIKASDSSLVNVTYTITGDYQMDVPNNERYLLIVFALNENILNGYNIHGYFPIGRFIDVEYSPLEENFIVNRAYEIVIEAYDLQGNLISEQDFTTVKWTTNSSHEIDEAKAAFAVWTGTGNETGFTVPSVLITPGERRDLWIQWETEGFGRINIKVDNTSMGFGGPAEEAEIIYLNFEVAKSIVQRANDKYNDYLLQGYQFSTDTLEMLSDANLFFADALSQTGIEQLISFDKSINASLWALEGLEMDRASVDIEINRKGNLTVTVLDTNDSPIADANVIINQTSHDFLFGVFDQVGEVGIETYEQLKDIGVNYATAGFYWSITEPTEGNFSFDAINDTIGVSHLVDLGLKVKAHAMIFFSELAIPDYIKQMTFPELNASVYSHIHTLVEAYADEIDIWNVVNEAHSKEASLNLTHEQMLRLIRTGVEAIRDADPDSEIIVNNAFFWFTEYLSNTFYLEEQDNYSMAVHEYLDWLESEDIDYDIVGQQMYNGGYASFLEDAGIGPGIPVSTFDMSTISEILDALENYGKPVHITEQSVSGTWNETDSWKDVGYWHGKWSPEIQADFLTYFYTLVFSKPSAEAITWWDLDDNHPFIKAGALFDENLEPKPIFYALKDFIAYHTSNEYALTNVDGNASFRAYGGDYNITIEKDGISVSISIHINETMNHHLTINLIPEGFYLNLNDFPMYEANVTLGDPNGLCGPAVAQMTLDYIWWNSSQNPEGEQEIFSQAELYTSGLENNTNDSLPYFDTQGMWHIIQYNKPMPYSKYGYNFAKGHNANVTEMIKQICQWINYTIGTYGGHKEGHPLHVPALVPTYGDYSNWMAIRGFNSNRSAYPMPDNIAVYGFWVNDPLPGSIIGENSFKTIDQWLSSYYMPLETDDIYNDEYVAILEPPEINEPTEFTISQSPARFNSQKRQLIQLIQSRKNMVPESLITQTNKWIVKAAIDGVTGQLIPYDNDFADVFEKTVAGKPLFVKNIDGNDYYIVPFNIPLKTQNEEPLIKTKTITRTQDVTDDESKDTSKKVTTVVILIDAKDGRFREASWVTDPIKYLPVSKEDAMRIISEKLNDDIKLENVDNAIIELVHMKSTPYYPDWKVAINNQMFIVNQDGILTVFN